MFPVSGNPSKIALKDVTLLGIDCQNFNRLLTAAKVSTKKISFGSIKLLTSLETSHKYSVKIPLIKSTEEYSKFILKNLNEYVDTNYVLIIQHDGFVLNPHAWSDEYLEYDYIGAPWWYESGGNVGNGGFSLRSKRLLEFTARENFIEKYHPEDFQICRTYRDYLLNQGMTFAPVSLAKKFSFEGRYRMWDNWNGQFGFHGYDVTGLKNWAFWKYAHPVKDFNFCFNHLKKIIMYYNIFKQRKSNVIS